MRFLLEIDCDNDAFKDDGEVTARSVTDEVYHILVDLSERVTLAPIDSSSGLVLRDTNGNTVGRARFIE